MTTLKINSGRLSKRIATLAEMTIPDKPWERTAFSDLHHQARIYLTQEMQKIGLETSIDFSGNLIGRVSGQRNDLSPIALGSHSDTVPEGGRYDGVAGVLIAMEIAQTLHEADHRLQHPLEVIDFLGEEPNKYGMSCVGSRGMIGYLTQEMLAYTAPDGSTLAEGISQMGGDPTKLDAPLRNSTDMAAFLEIHIEQARVLENSSEDIGSVTAIVGIARMEITITGVADHAGATPMNLRKDALTGAAQLITEFETKASSETRDPMVATVGKLEVSPNASNAIPGQVVFTLEIRAGLDIVLSDYMKWAESRVNEICQTRGLTAKIQIIGKSEPVQMADKVQDAILKAAKLNNFKSRSMPSGAGHDAAYMARIAPTGMVFIPCLEGRSHCPEEFATPEQLSKGAQTMLDALLSLDETLN